MQDPKTLFRVYKILSYALIREGAHPMFLPEGPVVSLAATGFNRAFATRV